jgi:hypothetical protein
VFAKESASVPSEGRAQPAVLLYRAKRLDEFGGVVIVQARVAADALGLQHVALRIREDRPSERPRLQRHHRQALEVRRHDEQLGCGHCIELVRIAEVSKMSDPRVFGDG